MEWSHLRKYSVVFSIIVPWCIYLVTICPTVYLGDSGELTAAAFSLGIPHNSGYPLYSLLGKIFCLIPIGNIGFRINFMSSCFAVLTIWLVHSIIFKLTSSSISSFVGSLALAFIPIFWMSTVSAEVYSLHAFFVVLLIRLLWWWDENKAFYRLALMMFIAGLSFGNHMQTVMLAPAIFFIIVSADRKILFKFSHFTTLSIFFILGLSLYIYLPIRTNAGASIAWGEPNTLNSFLELVTAKAHREGYVFTKNTFAYLSRIKEMLWMICGQLGVFLIFALLGGIVSKSVRWIIFLGGIILFDLFYTVFLNIISLEITLFLIPTSVVIAILIGLGSAKILEIGKYFHGIGHITQKMIMIVLCVLPIIPFLFHFNLCNQGRNYIAFELLVNMFRTVDNHGILFVDGDNYVFSATYGRIAERMREDVAIYDRQNIVFKMPYLGENDEYFFGTWKKVRGILEEQILDKKMPQGVFYAVFNPSSVLIPDSYYLIPFGVLDRVIWKHDTLDRNRLMKIWEYYSVEALNDNFEMDYLTRQVCANYYFRRGRYYIINGRTSLGLKYLKMASQIGYNDDMIHSDLAVFYTNYGYYQEALKELEKALVFHDDLSGIYNNWGYYYSKLGDDTEAIESFQKAIKLNPENYYYYNNLAFVLLRSGNKEGAMYAFQKSLMLKKEQKDIIDILKDLNSNLDG